MKPWHWILVVIGAVIILIAVVALFFLPRPQAPAQSAGNLFPTGTAPTTPDAFTKAFYVWYAGNVEEDSQFPTDHPLATVFGPWLTPEFIADWNTIGNDIDADPVLLSQDDPSKWGATISTSIASEDTSSATVDISIGSEGSVHAFAVSLVKATDGSWRISSINNG